MNRTYLAVTVMKAGYRSEGLENEMHFRVKILLQPVQIQNPELSGLNLQRKDLLQHADHMFSMPNQNLGGEEPVSSVDQLLRFLTGSELQNSPVIFV